MCYPILYPTASVRESYYVPAEERRMKKKKNDSTGVLLDNMLATVCRDIPG